MTEYFQIFANGLFNFTLRKRELKYNMPTANMRKYLNDDDLVMFKEDLGMLQIYNYFF